MVITYNGRDFKVLREVEGYYFCQLEDTELELMVKKVDVIETPPDKRREEP